MFIDPKDRRKVIVQGKDPRTGRDQNWPILIDDISFVYVNRGNHDKSIYINDFEKVPQDFFDEIGMTDWTLYDALVVKQLIRWPKYSPTVHALARKLFGLTGKDKLAGICNSCWSHLQYLKEDMGHNEIRCSEKDMYRYAKNRRLYEEYSSHRWIDTKSSLEQVMRMLGRDSFVKMPMKWNFPGGKDYSSFHKFANTTLLEGYYRPKSSVAKSAKEKHVHIHVHKNIYGNGKGNGNINIDINKMIDKIISGLMDRLFAFGSIKGKNSGNFQKVSPDIEEAEIVDAAEEICRSLVPVHQQKDLRAVILRRKNELMRRRLK